MNPLATPLLPKLLDKALNLLDQPFCMMNPFAQPFVPSGSLTQAFNELQTIALGAALGIERPHERYTAEQALHADSIAASVMAGLAL